MPKVVSEEEQKLTEEAIYEKAVELIKQKGLRAVTVNDIVQAVGIGKGTFYAYFPSKEVCLFKTILRFEKAAFLKFESILTSERSDKDKVVLLLNEVFVSEDSLITAVSPTDKEALLRKLPAEYREAEKEKSENHMVKALPFLNLNHEQMEVVALSMDGLNYMASNKMYGKEIVKTAQGLLINAISNFIYNNN